MTYRDGDPSLYNKIGCAWRVARHAAATAARAVDVLRMEGEATEPSARRFRGCGSSDGRWPALRGGRQRGGCTLTRGLDDAYFGGKVLRLNRDGSAPADNPRFDPAQPEAPVSYQWAKGLRNFVALAQRPGDDAIYTAENGYDVDRLLRLEAGQNYGYAGTDSSLLQRGLWFFSPAIAPVGVAFAVGGPFAADRQGNLYVGAFGPEPHSFVRGTIDHARRSGKSSWTPPVPWRDVR